VRLNYSGFVATEILLSPVDHVFRWTINRVTRVLLVLAILRYAIYGLTLAFELAQRGMEGVLSKLEHLTFMLTWRIGPWPTVWVEGVFALATSVLAFIYVRTRQT